MMKQSDERPKRRHRGRWKRRRHQDAGMTAKRQGGDCMEARRQPWPRKNGRADRGRANKSGEAEENKTAADKAKKWKATRSRMRDGRRR